MDGNQVNPGDGNQVSPGRWESSTSDLGMRSSRLTKSVLTGRWERPEPPLLWAPAPRFFSFSSREFCILIWVVSFCNGLWKITPGLCSSGSGGQLERKWVRGPIGDLGTARVPCLIPPCVVWGPRLSPPEVTSSATTGHLLRPGEDELAEIFVRL